MDQLPPQSDDPHRRSRRRYSAILGILIVVVVFVSGALTTSSGPASGTVVVSATQPASRSTFRVATFNIHSGIGADGKLDLDRTAKALAGFQLVGLNEVRGAFVSDDQTALLGRKLSLNGVFAPTENHWWHGHFGNAALTSLPVTWWVRTPMESSVGRGKRNMLVLEIPLEDITLRAIITHIDRQSDRAAQLQLVADTFAKFPEPVILMGDFNTPTSDPILLRLGASPGVTDCLTRFSTSALPAGNVDWIFVRGLECRRAGLVESGASDHPLAWAELSIPRAATRAATLPGR